MLCGLLVFVPADVPEHAVYGVEAKEVAAHARHVCERSPAAAHVLKQALARREQVAHCAIEGAVRQPLRWHSRVGKLRELRV